MRVLVVGAHRTSGRSMHRYTDLLVGAYRELGVELRVTTPPAYVSAHWRWPGGKWVGYVEKFIAFWPALWWAARSADVVHIADHSDSIWALGLARRRVFITCHDLIAVRAALGELPEHRPGLTGQWYQSLVLRGLGRAHEVFAVSRCTATDVERLTGRLSPLLYNPLDERVRAVADAVPGSAQGGLPPIDVGDYLLAVSTRGWRKHRAASVQAWTRLRRTPEFTDCALIVVGDALGDDELAIGRRAGASDRLIGLEDVSDAQLARLYQGARAMVHLSRYEGFGWPIVEAQAHRVPVLTTDGPIFHEIAGDHACFVGEELDDDSPAVWSGIAQQLMMVDLDAAAAAVHRFTWAAYVQALDHLVLGGGAGIDHAAIDLGAVAMHRSTAPNGLVGNEPALEVR